jgi:hypothetical protein
MGWFTRKKSVDDIIADSFSQQGRWQELSKNIWTDTTTGATLQTGKQGGVCINGVPVSVKVHVAFWEMIIKPYEAEKALKRKEMEKLYECE